MQERARVLTFGAVPWTNSFGADDYAKLLDGHCAHLCTHMTVTGNRYVLAGGCSWWESKTPSDTPIAAGSTEPLAGSTEPLSATFGVCDPLTCAFASEHALLSSTFAITEGRELDWSASAHDLAASELEDVWDVGASVHRLTRFPQRSLVSRQDILLLMQNALPKNHALLIDSLRLHRGRAYKAALRGLVRSVSVGSLGGDGVATGVGLDGVGGRGDGRGDGTEQMSSVSSSTNPADNWSKSSTG